MDKFSRKRLKGQKKQSTFHTLVLINDAQLGRFRAGERIIRGSSRGAGPVSGLLVLRTRESYGTVVAIVPEGRKLSYRQRIGSRRGCRLNHRDRGGYKLQEELIITRHNECCGKQKSCIERLTHHPACIYRDRNK